ncbi:MAG: hypothetical protein OXI73_02235 [Rhodospirillales bacterium]|nr:hypothetical protein [Rhodospirillales bacterium]
MSRKRTGGLAGMTAGRIGIRAAGKEGAGLTCRGHDIHDLAGHASFEGVAHLPHRGRPPNAAGLSAHRDRLRSLCALPGALKQALEQIERFDSPEAAEQGVRETLARKEPIMGFGHRAHTDVTPPIAAALLSVTAPRYPLSPAGSDERHGD